MDGERYEIRLGGSGGQGIIMAGLVLAEAVGIYEGKYVCQTQSYGPEARGGYSKAEVVISDRPIDYPKVMKPDFLLAMNQAACDAYYLDLKPDGLLVVDSTLVTQIPTSRVIALPFTEIARKKIGKEMVANMVALGAVGYLSKRVSPRNLAKALMSRVPKRTEKMNQQALNAGLKAAQGVVLEDLPRFLMPEEEEAM
jgi:2-oxoglutarate ferredoxin oxidoreductase subunit gamma